MEKIKICEVCGKEVVPKQDKHLNILNRYYHKDCLGKEKVVGGSFTPTYSQNQIAEMTFDEIISYLGERIKALSAKYDVPEEETIELRLVVQKIAERYASVAKAVDKKLLLSRVTKSNT
jgi:hypothetical protein